MNKWQDPNLSLGQRCVAFAEFEMANGVGEDRPNSFTSPRLREYFKICTRLVNGKETPIGLSFTSGNWCSAGVSFCLQQSILPGETLPHGFRLGVVEVIADMQRVGTYRPIDHARRGLYHLKVGDPIFFDRSNPKNPASAWWRHIGRVYAVLGNGKFVCISGNNGGKWRLSEHNLGQTTLIGFGEYPPANMVAPQQTLNNVPIDWNNVDVNSLAPPIDTAKGLAASNVFGFFGNIFGRR
jgi:hypothetical protein